MTDINTSPRPRSVSIVIPAGVLGAGIIADQVERGLAAGAAAIAIDAGSTDSGPAYLATATSKMSRDAIRRDLRILMSARQKWDVPLLIGSCGTCGADAAVDWTADIVAELAAELGQTPRVVRLYSEQTADRLKAKIAAGQTRPLAPMAPLEDATLNACDHIVALMGHEPFARAVHDGADIVLGGRTTDTAVIAAVPLLLGCPAGPSWHAGKIAECGALCTVDPMRGGVLIRIDASGFEIEPLALDNRCTPYTVSAHMLYENADPFRLVEPAGVLDVTDATYVAIDDRTVRVEGSRFEETDVYTMKLEGAGGGPFQTLMLIGIADPKVLASLDLWMSRLETALHQRIADNIDDPGDYALSLRAYGSNALTGLPTDPDAPAAREAGVLFVASAATQDMATRIAKLCNPWFFHFPLEPGSELPSYAFPFSPAEIERGRAYVFHLNHVVETTGPFELVRVVGWDDVAQAAA